jgi:hypothetical protein
MKVIIHNTGNTSEKFIPKSNNPHLQRYGVWGIVSDVHPKDHSVDVNIDYGPYLGHVPVSSNEWVVPGKEYTSGMRNLPPKGGRVFIMMPTGTFDDCFVLCSGMTPLDKNHREAFMQEGKETERHRVTPGNWKSKYQYEDGSFELVSPDKKTSIKLDLSQKDHTLDVTLFEKIKMAVTALKSFFLSLFDTTEIEIKEGGIIITSPKVKHIINGDKTEDITGKFYFGNSSQNMQKLLLELIDEIIAAQWYGDPGLHNIHPQTKIRFETFKESYIKSLFKEGA